MFGFKETSALFLLLMTAASLPYDHLDDQVNAAIDAGTFQNPSSNIRPKFRYWLPDASVNVDNLAADFTSIASIGAGTIQLLNYWLYGGAFVTQSGVPVDWDTYNFGTPAYNDVLIAALQSCKDNGLLMDFSVGVQSGQGAPAEIDNPGLAWFLNSSMTTVSPGQTLSGTIPGFGGGSLVSVVTAEITNHEAVSDYTLYTLTESSLQEVTSNVTSDGTLNITFPDDNAVEGYLIYASYALQPLVRSGIAGPNPQNFIQNGSFAVDHFSSTGAKVTTDFLEQYVLVNGAKELIEDVGNYIWEDSIEIQGPGIYWTPNLTTTFESQHNYSILPYLALLAQQDGSALSPDPPFSFQTSSLDKGASYVNDFRATLTTLYGEYVHHWTNWSNTYLNLQSSAQIGYNLPVDVQANIPFNNAPEGETLQFQNAIDAFRQFCGPANLAGKRVISVELGAMVSYAYSFSLPTLLQNAKRSFSGGINTFVIHGSPYSYSYPNTTWPGYTSFIYEFSEQHQRHQPAWENGYKEAMDWLARTSFVMQSGIPKRDIVFWDKETFPDESLPNLYEPMDLIGAGYTYDYLSPDNFALPQAVVTNNTLALSGPGYRALVLRQNDTLTPDGVAKLSEFANAGLPIIAAGGFPSYFSAQNSTANEFVNNTLTTISSLPNVHIIADIPIASTLQSLNIIPRTQVSTNGTWATVWRSNATADYVFIFSDGSDSVGTITFAALATPYFFDAWTGIQSPVPSYSVNPDEGTTSIILGIKANQTLIIAFTNETVPGVELPAIHFTNSPSEILGFSYTNSTLRAKIPFTNSNSPINLATSDGQTHTFTTDSAPPSFPLSNWSLLVEHWDPPSNLSDIETIALKTNTTHPTLPYPLPPWPSIPNLANTSGLGYYTTNFTWPPPDSPLLPNLGAQLTFTSPILHTLQLSINSLTTPPLDPTDPTIDITEYLVEGVNSVEAKVATIMYNGLVPILDQLRTAGSGLGLSRELYPEEREVGLVGGVVVAPFVWVDV